MNLHICTLLFLSFSSCIAMDTSSLLDYDDMKKITLKELDTYIKNIGVKKPPLVHGYNLLHAAVIRNAPKRVQIILNTQHCDINEHDNLKGYTPLFIACQNSNKEIVAMLLYYGADPNIPSKNGVTPLIKSIQKNQFDCISMLILFRADVNHKDTINNRTPLHTAITYENSAIVELLLYHKASPNLDLQYCFTPLMAAAQMDIDSKNKRTHNAKIIKNLLDYGADHNIMYLEDQDTALHIAVNQSNTLAVYFLLKAGAHPNVFNAGQKSPLLLALENSIDSFKEKDYRTLKQNCFITRLLLLYNAQLTEQELKKINLKDVLKMAIKCEVNELVKFSLAAGANVNYIYGLGNRPLHIFAKKAKVKKSSSLITPLLLLGYGANCMHINTEKYTALDIILKKRYTSLFHHNCSHD